ncbi:MAG TPA: hypothetical protein VFU02_15220, partial [Polyangiaceae bacterium]|nr:hypothetical protein [Polyangiaceae bacterium]
MIEKGLAHIRGAQAARAMRLTAGVLLLGFVAGCGPDGASESIATKRLALNCSSGGSAPGEWTSVDIGSPTTGATCYYPDGSFVVEGYGEGVARPGETPDTDQMRFVYRDAPGDIEIAFRLTALSGPAGDGATRAGVAIRAGTAADAEMGSGLIGLGAYESADPDADEQAVAWRTPAGTVHGSGGVPGPSIAAGPIWFRLQRVGNDFAVARRADDSPFWVPVSLPGGGAFTASSSVKVGFFVSGGSGSTAATATFDHIYVGPPRTTHRDTWVGSSFDQASTGWVAQSLNTLYVPPDGSRVFRYYDTVEEGATVQAYDGATGAIEAIPGYIAGGVQQGVMAGDGTSIYVAKLTGSGSFCVERRDPDLLLQASCASGVALGPIGGMAVGPDGSDTLVYVSQPSTGTIVALDAQTLAVDRSFSVNARPGPLAVDHGGYLWVAHTATEYPNVGSYDVLYTASIRSYEPDGTYTGREIDDVVNPTALAVDPSANRLLVAENGPNQNIRIYEDLGTTPALETTFGEPGGIFSTTRGRVFDASHGGAARFYSLSGVSMDENGNIYVAAGGRGGAGLDIRKFDASGDLEWSTYGLLNFLNMVDFDPATDGEDLYGARHHLTFDPDQSAPGSEWGFSALTWNPFPTSGDVETDEHGRIGRRSGGPRLVTLGSQRFMFLPASERDDDPNPNTMSDPASWADNNRIVMNIYRFEGETAVMCGSITTELVCGFGTIGPADGPGTPYYECARMSAEECPCNVDDDSDDEVLANFGVMRLWVDTD